MIETVVQYLHGARVPFRLSSYPSQEAEPKAGHALRPGSVLVDARLVLVGGRPAIACWPMAQAIDLGALGATVGEMALEATTLELPGEFAHADGPVPPLGQLFGLPVIVDRTVTECAILVFRAFEESDYFEIPYEDYARLEQPRVAEFASVGELPPRRPRATKATRGPAMR